MTEMLDADMSHFSSMLARLPQKALDVAAYWEEDKLIPRDPVGDRRLSIFYFLVDKYGRGVADHWVERGYPEPFSWTEIIRTSDG